MFEALALFNNDKIIWGITMLLMNVGSKYVLGDIGQISEVIFKNEYVKKIVIFSMFFVATRDLLYAFVLSVGYVLIVDGVLSDKQLWHKQVNDQEYEKAIKTIKAYEAQKPVPTVDYENYLNNIGYVMNNESLRHMR